MKIMAVAVAAHLELWHVVNGFGSMDLRTWHTDMAHHYLCSQVVAVGLGLRVLYGLVF